MRSASTPSPAPPVLDYAGSGQIVAVDDGSVTVNILSSSAALGQLNPATMRLAISPTTTLTIQGFDLDVGLTDICEGDSASFSWTPRTQSSLADLQASGPAMLDVVHGTEDCYDEVSSNFRGDRLQD